MRLLIRGVSLFFIIAGVLMVAGVVATMISEPPRNLSFPLAATAIITLITPGAMVIIFGSVSYMLCSIDMRLEEMANRPPPKVTVAAPAQGQPQLQSQPASFARDHDLF